ncbi:MAG TPA: site-2 protease family protein [Candidatus Acidoferrum sp.]|jgi:Zn-dependent protease|nr:site-2 protease family protein [Candidatus Acidoferrum sp.]
MEVFLLVTAAWVFSVCLHEFGHALVAYYGGDHTVKEKGYLTLNPVHYSHPVYSLVMPLVFLFLGGIGLPGGAVYINDHLLRSRGWRTAVSLAGPLMNALLVLLLCAPFWLGLIDERFGPALAFLIQLQLSAILFNLVPIPPLDGFQALAPWMPREFSEKLLANANVFMWSFILILWYVPPANQAFWTIVYTVSDRLGIDHELALTGWWQFQFWRR